MNVQIDHRLRLSSFKQRALDTGQINGRKQTAGYRRKGWTNASRVTSLKSQPREIDFDDFENGLLDLQSKIVDETQDLDASERRFCHDRWDRPSRSGFGITRVMENGRIIEKGAVNISILRGILSPERAQSMSSRGRGIDPSGKQPDIFIPQRTVQVDSLIQLPPCLSFSIPNILLFPRCVQIFVVSPSKISNGMEAVPI